MKQAGKHTTHEALPSLPFKRNALWFVLLSVALTIIVLMAATAHASLTCDRCHSMPPTDSPVGNRDPLTGGFKGNHAGHSDASANSCTPCHGSGVTAYTAAHISEQLSVNNGRVIKLTNRIHNYSTLNGRAQYSRGIFLNQTAMPPNPLGTCSNVNCHFEVTTPAWGSANFSAPGDCDKCHGAPPSGGATGAAGSHAKHDQYYPGTSNCRKCHSNNTTFKHATSAGGRDLIVNFAAAPNNGDGVYSGPVNDYLPSQNNNFGTCTALYCHSDGRKAMGNLSTNTVPAWGGTAMPANCTGCHRADSASGTVMKSGSHTKHVTGLNTIACSKCHAATAGGMTIVDTAVHVNGAVNIKFNSLTTAVNGSYAGQATPLAKTPGTAYGQCNNVYCHSTIQSGADGKGAPTYRTPTWGTAGTGACGSCHDGDDGHTFGKPVMSSGSHTTHLSFSFGGSSNTMKCAICHNIGGKTMTLGQSCDSTFCHAAAPAKHANGQIDVGINPYYGATASYNGSLIPQAGFSTCSNVSCHFNTTTPTWGTSTPIGCLGCHSLAVLLASGSHAKHIKATAMPAMYNYTANRSTTTEYDFGCSNCHPLDGSNHMNGLVNVTLSKTNPGAGGVVGTLRSKNSSTANGIGVANSGIAGTTRISVICSAAYCHSNGMAAQLVYATTPDWYGGSFTGDRCANCHGNSPNSTIPGSKAHYNNRFLGYSGISGGHAVGIHAMSVYTSATRNGTERATSHGNAATATTISCNICHYATVTSVRNDQNQVCKTCHFAGNSLGALTGNGAVIANKSKHLNGAVDVEFKNMAIVSKAQMRSNGKPYSPYSSIWRRDVGYKVPGSHDTAKTPLDTATMWNETTKTCSNIACHNGEPVRWSDTDGTTNCVSCHATL